jgi:hypothetical protein
MIVHAQSSRITLRGGEKHTVDRGQDQHRERGGPEQGGEVAERHPAPRHVAQAERVKHDQLEHDHAPDRCQIHREPTPCETEVVAGEEGHEEREGKQDSVGDEQ